MFRFLPEQASEIAPKIDWLHHVITDISLFFTVAIVGSMIYFAIRYRQKGDTPHETPRIFGSHLLEMIWTIVPTIICIYVAYYGIVYYRDLRTVPENALTINVQAKKWQWDFEYDNGKKSTAEFVVPVNQPIKMVMRSNDVLHSFFIPAMRVKADVIPQRYTYVSFKAVKTGTYQTYCTEYCGDNHSQMLAKVHVVAQDEYDRWLNATEDRSGETLNSTKSPAKLGAALYQAKGCNVCHSLNGARLVGPTFLKLYGREEMMESGEMVKADENYISESILNPMAKVVKGYPPVMPSYAGQLDQNQIDQLIAFMKTLDGSAPVEAEAPKAAAADTAKMSPEERGKIVYQTKLCMTCHSIDGSRLVGPSFKGAWGAQHKMQDGTVVTVDEGYVRESIKNPNAKIVEGYPPAMPAGLLDDAQTEDFIAYLKTLK